MHEHGPHSCYCPTCGYTTEVEEYVKCNTLYCPTDGSRLRAVETGEFRANVATKVATVAGSIPCPVCGYPVPDPRYLGEEVRCAYCGTISETISQVTVPSTVVAALVGFGLGVLLGPTAIAAVEAGSQKLAKKSRERLS